MNVKICGVLVEPRRMDSVYKLIENYRSVLGEMPLYFFCGKSTYNHYIDHYKSCDFINIINLGVDNLTANQHNDLWKQLSFWKNFVNYDYVLTIQTDGCLCKNSKFKLDDFIEYDYVGGYSPYKWWWKETNGLHNYSDYQCFNGGFSLRKVKSMIHVLETFEPLPTVECNSESSFREYGEDLYFVVGLLTLNINGMTNYKLGLDEKAIYFCTHTHYVNNTFCVHKLDNYVNDKTLNTFLEYCPEFEDFIGRQYSK